MSILAVLLLAAVFFYGLGGVFRLLFAGETKAGFSAAELIGGYGLGALLLQLSLQATGDYWLGAGIAVLLCGAVIFHLLKRGWRPAGFDCKSPAFRITALFVILLAILYAPVLLTGGVTHKLPEIYDFPKHIEAVLSAAHPARQLPNPYFPAGEFAYNTLYYLPIGLLCRLTGSVNSAPQLFVLTLLWTAVVLIQVLYEVMKWLDIAPKWLWLGLLYTTAIGNFKPIFNSAWLATHHPATAEFLRKVVKSAFSAEDPFVFAAYVPQHLFALAALFALFVVCSTSPPGWRRNMGAMLLAAAAVQTSLILAPLSLFCAGLALVWLWWDQPAAGLAHRFFAVLPSGLLLAVLTLPILIAARRWTGAAHLLVWIWPDAGNSRHLLLFIWGPFFPLAATGLYSLGRTAWRGAWFFILAPSLLCLFFLLFLHYPDSDLKYLMALRYALIPAALLGFIRLHAILAGRLGRAGAVIAALIWIVPAGGAAVNCAYLFSRSFTPRPSEERDFIRAAQALPREARILLLEKNQELAAMSGHLGYQDFSNWRPDRYLPAAQRPAADRYFSEAGLSPLPPEVLKDLDAVASLDPRRQAGLEAQFGPPIFRDGNYSLYLVGSERSN